MLDMQRYSMCFSVCGSIILIAVRPISSSEIKAILSVWGNISNSVKEVTEECVPYFVEDAAISMMQHTEQKKLRLWKSLRNSQEKPMHANLYIH